MIRHAEEENTYNTGKVTAKSFVGGLIGSLYKGNEINNSYNEIAKRNKTFGDFIFV